MKLTRNAAVGAAIATTFAGATAHGQIVTTFNPSGAYGYDDSTGINHDYSIGIDPTTGVVDVNGGADQYSTSALSGATNSAKIFENASGADLLASSPNTTIDSTSTGWVTGGGIFDYVALSNGENFVGFRLQTGTDSSSDPIYNYGFFDIVATNTGVTGSAANEVTEVAYNTVAGAAITTPEPGTTGLLALGAAGLGGLALLRRRRSFAS